MTKAEEKEVMDNLAKVIDPELGVDLVNLGLIYGVEVDETGLCTITMTLTTMGCPLTDWLNENITKAARAVEGVKDCKINLVWYPTWSPAKMSRVARLTLGIS